MRNIQGERREAARTLSPASVLKSLVGEQLCSAVLLLQVLHLHCSPRRALIKHVRDVLCNGNADVAPQ